MNSQRFQRMREIYRAALERPPDRRIEFVEQICCGDAQLQHEVQSLLIAEAEAAGRFTATVDEATANAMPLGAAGPLPPGRILGSYEVLSPIGAGGMGEVYLAREMRLSRNVAIKLLPGSQRLDSERVRRFEREARAASALNHPNIITIYDIGTCEAGRFIVMKLRRRIRAVPHDEQRDHFIDDEGTRRSMNKVVC